MDRMTPLDAAFLQAEDERAGRLPGDLLGGGLRGTATVDRGVRGAAAGPVAADPALPAEGPADPVRPRATGMGGRRALRPRLPPAPDRAARPGRRRRAVGADRPGDGRPAGPRPAAVGVLARRAAARRPLGADLQGAPLHGRRRLRHRPVRRGARPDAEPAPAGAATTGGPSRSRRTWPCRPARSAGLAVTPVTQVRATTGALRQPGVLARPDARGRARTGRAVRRARAGAPLLAHRAAVGGQAVRRRPRFRRRRVGGPEGGTAVRSTTSCSPRWPAASAGCSWRPARSRPAARCARWCRCRPGSPDRSPSGTTGSR